MPPTASDPQIVPRQPAAAPALRAADQGVADALESVLSQNALRVYGTPWCLFIDWCADVGLHSLPAEPLTVARYLRPRRCRRHQRHLESPRVGQAGIALPVPGRARLSEGIGTGLSRPQRQSGALTAVQPRRRSRGTETPDQAAERGKFDVALVVALSDAGLCRSEAAADLGRRAALGRRQRRRHRGPLQDRRRSPGHRSSHHPPPPWKP